MLPSALFRFRSVTLGAASVLVLAGASAALAQSRQLDAHVHGESTLAVAIDGARVVIELDAPGMDIVGFEHAPESDADKEAVAAAREVLSDPVTVFGVPSAAGCEVASQSVELAIEGAEHEHAGEGHADDDHADDNHANEDHAAGEHAAEQHADAEHSEEASGGHSGFEGRYELTCAAPEQLGGLDVAFFSLFPGAVAMDVVVVTSSGQTAAELSANETSIDF